MIICQIGKFHGVHITTHVLVSVVSVLTLGIGLAILLSLLIKAIENINAIPHYRFYTRSRHPIKKNDDEDYL